MKNVSDPKNILHDHKIFMIIILYVQKKFILIKKSFDHNHVYDIRHKLGGGNPRTAKLGPNWTILGPSRASLRQNRGQEMVS